MTYSRGHIPWNKGKKGLQIGWNKGKKGLIGYWMGKKRPPFSKKWKDNMVGFKKGYIPWNKGIVGKKSHSWIKDRAKIVRRNRSEDRYIKWRVNVFTRDNFCCRINNQDCRGQLQAHHILPWRDYEKIRYDINNGITLCQFHHPRVRNEEKRLVPVFRELVSVSKV